MTFTLPFRLTPDQAPKDIVNGTEQNFEAVTTALNTNSFKIAKVVTTSVSGPANITTATTVVHGLGFTPILLAFLGDSANYQPLPGPIAWAPSLTGITFSLFINIQVDAQNIYLFFINGSGADYGPFPIKCYLLQETATAS